MNVLSKRLVPSPSLVISLIALFVALGGTTYAATRLPANSVGTKQLKRNAVTSRKIKNHAVTAVKINTTGLTVSNALHAGNSDDLGGAAASEYALAKQLLFTNASLENGWTPSGTLAPASYAKDQFGIVHLAGAVGQDASPTTAVIFTLPAGLRPATQVYEPAVFAGPSAGVVRIDTNGDVSPASTAGFVDMEGISFPAGG